MSKTTMATTIVEWKDIPWAKLERYTFKLQNRIFKASQEGRTKEVRKWQKLLMKSQSARTLAVRQISQDNQGKHTAGVDGFKSLTPMQRTELVIRLKTPMEKASPTRRVWIPKPNSEEKRPLGIPTMEDRARQALAKKAIEPEWEAKFEPNSYGFRPGRSTHDAISAIFMALSERTKYILDADIAKCFDRINHDALLDKLNTYPTMRRQIKSWLKAGVMEGKKLFATEEGTPQGGVISPLLANIALHGLEEHINKAFPRQRGNRWNRKGIYTPDKRPAVKIVRYADDFVIIHDHLEVIHQAKELTQQWLKELGLELKPSKTRITHSLNEQDGNVGFNFLGFTIRQFPVSKFRSTKKRGLSSELKGYKTIIKPNKDCVKRHYDKLAGIIDKYKAGTQTDLIARLNPIIRGWSYYYKHVVSALEFHRLDDLVHQKLWAWSRRRHSTKGRKWRYNRYWKTLERKWVFTSQAGNPIQTLRLHAQTKIERHTKVIENKSPYDGNWPYWATRLGKSPLLKSRAGMLMKKQKGKCSMCGLYFREGDSVEVDHVIPTSKRGKDTIDNLQLLHKHCHQIKTKIDLKREAG